MNDPSFQNLGVATESTHNKSALWALATLTKNKTKKMKEKQEN